MAGLAAAGLPGGGWSRYRGVGEAARRNRAGAGMRVVRLLSSVPSQFPEAVSSSLAGRWLADSARWLPGGVWDTMRAGDSRLLADPLVFVVFLPVPCISEV